MSIASSFKLFACPHCKNRHSLDEWDETTLTVCNCRKVRRSFKSLKLQSSRSNGSRRIYVCPSCNKFINGNDIIITEG